MASCTICSKRAVSGSLVSHSQIHTKRKFRPNLQKVNGVLLCTRCLKSIKKITEESSVLEKA
ncbi:MAG TPA: bL28 family ribosomal protein [bacterium]|nr:bL28 family ribosomal protein [bacterium]